MIRKGLTGLVAILGLSASATVLAQDQSLVEQGSQVFDKWCRICHGEPASRIDMIGTQKLQERYQGAVPAKLEDRTNLTPEFIEVIVRNGIGLMPFFRKIEVSDADLEALQAYLTRNNP